MTTTRRAIWFITAGLFGLIAAVVMLRLSGTPPMTGSHLLLERQQLLELPEGRDGDLGLYQHLIAQAGSSAEGWRGLPRTEQLLLASLAFEHAVTSGPEAAQAWTRNVADGRLPGLTEVRDAYRTLAQPRAERLVGPINGMAPVAALAPLLPDLSAARRKLLAESLALDEQQR